MSAVTAGAATVAGTAELHDVCVIGSGPAGAFVAYELVAAGARVVLVEAGEAVTPGAPSPLSPAAVKHRGSGPEPHGPPHPPGTTLGGRVQTPPLHPGRLPRAAGRTGPWYPLG